MGNPQLRPKGQGSRSICDEPKVPLLPSAAQQRAERLASGRIIIACGGRDYQDRERVFAALDCLHERAPVTLLVHGACMTRGGRLQGADRWADEWARERGVEVEMHPADWLSFGDGAGPMRNRQMAQAGAHGCVAFPGGRGTEGMMVEARFAGIKVWRPYG